MIVVPPAITAWMNLNTMKPFAATFRQARLPLTQHAAAEALSSPRAPCPVATIQAWEQGRQAPPAWVQALVLERLKNRKTSRQ